MSSRDGGDGGGARNGKKGIATEGDDKRNGGDNDNPPPHDDSGGSGGAGGPRGDDARILYRAMMGFDRLGCEAPPCGFGAADRGHVVVVAVWRRRRIEGPRRSGVGTQRRKWGGAFPRRSRRRLRLHELRMRGRRDLIRREGRDGRFYRYHLPPYERQ